MGNPTEQVVTILRRVDIFDNLSAVQYDLIAYLCHEDRPQTGTILFREQEQSDDLYVIAAGGVEVLVDTSVIVASDASRPEERVLTELREGQVFGEVALVDQGIRSASIRISRPNTYLLRIPRKQLIALCDTYPALGYRIMRNLAAELALKLRNSGLTFREFQLSLSKHESAERGGENAP
ncbi:MAG: cyclic nucleotide-binding domain-containing protein [Candidatus Promineifilaceae bacterium]